MVDEEDIDALDVPESDKALLRKFIYEDWANIIPEKCVSDTATRIAQDLARHARSREEHSLGID